MNEHAERDDIRFVTTGLSADEVAAVTAVLTTALRARTHAAGERTGASAPSAWGRSARSLRQPVRSGWRNFTAEGL